MNIPKMKAKSFHHTPDEIYTMRKLAQLGHTIQFWAKMYLGQPFKWHDCADQPPKYFHYMDKYRVKPEQ